ncbi:hypothetical protein SAMN04487906_1398 [Zhouia amylolytica]|uniref:Lipoprotein n=1 Tax=Zhouia amylolytica TaxID=376730 RepID=A0A1I6S2R8_9FLAO|nr:hypothetical protein [Zhouia amylolytica]SFS71275.1 hypothetical protein SAMN04487906_1398 [Zhouia amylolytica]
MKLHHLIVTILIVIFVSCSSDPASPEKSAPTSDFSLQNDYNDLNAKLTHLDTLIVETDLSVCTSERYERLTITQKDSVLHYSMEIRDTDNPAKVTLETQHSKSSVRWNLSSFLTENTNRFNPVNDQDRERMRIMCNGDTINLYTQNLVDSNKFIGAYYTTMSELFPYATDYDFVKVVLEEE